MVSGSFLFLLTILELCSKCYCSVCVCKYVCVCMCVQACVYVYVCVAEDRAQGLSHTLITMPLSYNPSPEVFYLRDRFFSGGSTKGSHGKDDKGLYWLLGDGV